MNYYNERMSIIRMGKQLLEMGLLVRTWGNISHRINEFQFLITPSGKGYENIEPEDLVLVNMNDLSYEGEMKPSSEKGTHCEVYKQRPNVNIVVHTHQRIASALSSANESVLINEKSLIRLIGNEILCAPYGLPSTKKLRRGIEQTLRVSTSNAILLSKHGVLCFGEEEDEILRIAQEIETVCKAHILHKSRHLSVPIHSILETNKEIVSYSKRNGDKMEYFHKDVVNIVDLYEKDDQDYNELTSEEEMHKEIYHHRKDINYIIHTDSPSVLAFSKEGIVLKPYLDDLAQICGVSIPTIEKSSDIINKLRGRHAVFIKDQGALCCGSNKEEAEAVEIILEKGTLAFLISQLFGKKKPIPYVECLLMRQIYIRKYSKLKGNE